METCEVEGEWEVRWPEGEGMEDAFGFDALLNLDGLVGGGRKGRAGKSVP